MTTHYRIICSAFGWYFGDRFATIEAVRSALATYHKMPSAPLSVLLEYGEWELEKHITI